MGIEISFVVTCMGRLGMIEQTFGSAAHQPASEYVFVDWSCPDKGGDWVELNSSPTVQVVRVPGKQFFNLSAARNAGAAVARGKWLAFLDADYRLASNFVESLLPSLKPEHAYMFFESPSMGGFLVCERDNFKVVQGYDDVLENWGYEDTDLVQRLSLVGVTITGLPMHLASHVEHENSLRDKNYSGKDMQRSITLNHLYSALKLDLMTIEDAVNIPRNFRQMLYTTVKEAWEQAVGSRRAKTVSIKLGDLQIPPRTGKKGQPYVRRQIVYEVSPQEGGER